MPNTRQRLFSRYVMATLVDLVVLNLIAEYSARLTIESFGASLLCAILLQVLLQGTLELEHRIGSLFLNRRGALWKVLQYLSAWVILFGSKFVMLGVLDRILGDAVHFSGAMHGAGSLILTIIAMLAAEEIITRIFRSLADKPGGQTQS